MMTGAELQAIRRQLCGTDTLSFGRMLGYEGKDSAVPVNVRRLETMARIPGWFAKLATIYLNNPNLKV